MSSLGDTQLVVRNTFLEFVPKAALRSRAFSDSWLSSSGGSNAYFRKPSLDAISDVSTDTSVAELDEDGTNTSAHGDSSLGSGNSFDCFQQVTIPQSAVAPCPGAFWIPVQATVPGWYAVPCRQNNAHECWTTLMLKNIPNDYTREMLVKLLDDEGFSCKYDFVYLPIDFKRGSAFGYAFINLVTPKDTRRFQSHFHGFCRWAFPSRKKAEVTWSRPVQGLAATVERYRNSPIMHQDVPDGYKPCMFKNGSRVCFPSPTKPLSLPEEIAGSSVGPSSAVRNQQSACNVWRRSGKSESESSERTTLMLRNVPNDYSRSMLLSLIDEQGFAGKYDFVYLPTDFASGAGVGYAFINMVSHRDAEHFRVHFTGFSAWAFSSRKVAEVAWSIPNQGRAVHIEKYRNSAVMHPSVCDEFKPALFANGVRVPFPPPTRFIKAPQQ